jgi:cytochrome oxidase Cu insertion factor (SCO1/SenC/PrrC family)
MIESWRITRRKLGLARPELGEFHLMIEVKDSAQLDRADGKLKLAVFHFKFCRDACSATLSGSRQLPQWAIGWIW